MHVRSWTNLSPLHVHVEVKLAHPWWHLPRCDANHQATLQKLNS